MKNLKPITAKVSIPTLVKAYKKRAQEIESYLSKKPGEWGRFQAEFNSEVNKVFRDIMNFEKEMLANNQEEKVYKLKQLFVNKIRATFLRGENITWSLSKPFGYAGDFKIIDAIYQNYPVTNGFDRLFDNYFQMSAISVAVRNRKDDFKRFIVDFINSSNEKDLCIMNLASGPCREIKEIISCNTFSDKNVVFDCYDNDVNSIEYAKNLLKNTENVNFTKENALKIAFRKDISTLIDKKYDFIYSTGLFDYFEEKVATRAVENLRKLLKPDGVMAIATMRDKYSNPSVHFMEWVGDWNLVYRDDDNFMKIFCAAGFNKEEITLSYEQQGIIQYITAVKTK